MQGSLDMPRLRTLGYKRDITLEMPLISGGCLDTLLQSKLEMAKQRVPPENVSNPTSTSVSLTAADTACTGACKESTTTIPARRLRDSQPIIGFYLKEATVSDDSSV
ncbi:hypothetical protein BGX30_015222 [Mortierella sp. GBA39]|nr:hypothetical protein BGX30_015222 [Mortierella sp. GBA39]